MQFSLATIVLALAGIVAAQVPVPVPDCATICLVSTRVAVSCRTDFQCICSGANEATALAQATPCIGSTCSAADAAAAPAAFMAFCDILAPLPTPSITVTSITTTITKQPTSTPKARRAVQF